MYHFFTDKSNICGNTVYIRGGDVNHIKNVLRMRPGEEISVGDGENEDEYRCIIEEFEDDAVRCKLAFVKTAGVESPSRIYLFQGLPKNDKMELIIQKCVEMGVYKIIPVETKRCVVKLEPQKAASKVERWQAISEAAAKQSKRSIIPEVSMPVSFTEALKEASELDVKIIPYELCEVDDRTTEIFENIKPGENIGIFIGPEGGFEESEVEKAREAGVLPVTLGRRILRTETAGFTVLAWLMYKLEIFTMKRK